MAFAPSLHAAEPLSSAAVQAAATYSAKEDGAALIIMQHGKVLLHQTQNGRRENEALRIYSGTKFFWCMAACCAVDDKIFHWDDAASDTILEWKGTKKAGITIRQLLNFTSGLPPMEELHEDNVSDRSALAIRAELSATPGTRFIYGPASLQVFYELLKRKLAARRDTPLHFFERRVLRPLGLGPQRYVMDKAGNPLLAAGFMLTADQWLSVGKLLAKGGSPVIDNRELQECLRGTSPSPAFGMGLWNNHLAGAAGSQEVAITKQLLKKWPQQSWRDGCLCKAAPADLIASIGSHGQRIYVVPSMDVIVVRMGVRGDFTDAAFLRLLFGK